jgi:hypothetical protein
MEDEFFTFDCQKVEDDFPPAHVGPRRQFLGVALVTATNMQYDATCARTE